MVPPGYPQPAPGYGGYAPAGPPTDGMAVAALVLGIISIPGVCCYGIVGLAAGITAVILGRMSLRKITAAGGMIGGRGLAQAGWICGLVGAVLGGLYGLFTIALFIFGIAGSFGSFTFPSPSP
jgi:hypothetical protein